MKKLGWALIGLALLIVLNNGARLIPAVPHIEDKVIVWAIVIGCALAAGLLAVFGYRSQ